ncbi:cellulase family glycosylhydrolase [Sphaerobacter sp.]|uniref:cellulase family glycosylhydrolase n=1 Tax=Sphaerobacter sp. TaxID=2099654 RepID=UPI001D208577|nr:cellulase family glycosylhydrolase [Sphaerobacter sp.]MBX5444239.1 cellulase family glycosylhydrolase [Sphaerobacter sp.]
MRRIALFVLLVMVATMVVACGGGSSTPTPAGESTSTAQANPTAGEASPTATASNGAPSGETGSRNLIYGFNVFARGDDQGAEFNDKVIDMVTGAGFDWVRIQIEWSQFERAKGQWDPLPTDRIVDQFEARGVNVLATIVKAPDWARDPSGQQLLSDYNDFAEFVQFVVGRYHGKVDAWEIWNEQNLAHEMGGTVRVEDYAKMLEAAYQAAKSVDRSAVIVFGGLTPTGVNDPSVAIDDVAYLESFYALENGRYAMYFDVLGAHVNATNHPPDKMFPDNPGEGNWADHPSFYFRRAEQLHEVMAKYGDPRPVWITEFGWTTANQAPGYEYGADVSEQDQADYLVGAFKWAQENWPWARGMFVWNLNYSVITPPEDEKHPWSVLNADWSPRPAYEALRDMPKP